jgi:hypothetical protein
VSKTGLLTAAAMTANQSRNRQRILPHERKRLDSQMVERLQSLHQVPIRTSNRVLVDVDKELGRVFRNASKRERWVFSSVAAERAAEVAAAFDLFSESADLTDLRHFVLRPLGEKPTADQLPAAIKQLSDAYDQYVGPLVSDGLIKPLLCAIHVRYDQALGVFDPHAHCVWRVATDDLDAVFQGVQTKFSTVWMEDKPIKNPAALVNYVVTWIIDHRALQDWPKDALLALWRLPRPRFMRPAGLFAKFKGTLKGHRLVRQDGAVKAVPVQKRPAARKKVCAGPLHTGSVVGFVHAKVLGKLRWCAIAVVNGRDRLSRRHIDDILAQSTWAARKASRGYPATTTGLSPFPADPVPQAASAPPPVQPISGYPAKPCVPCQPQGPGAQTTTKNFRVGLRQKLLVFLSSRWNRLMSTVTRIVRNWRSRMKRQQGP